MSAIPLFDLFSTPHTSDREFGRWRWKIGICLDDFACPLARHAENLS
jgi:hypothetical protein